MFLKLELSLQEMLASEKAIKEEANFIERVY